MTKAVYKYTGKHTDERLQGGFFKIQNVDPEDVDGYLADGWFLTSQAARAAHFSGQNPLTYGMVTDTGADIPVTLQRASNA